MPTLLEELEAAKEENRLLKLRADAARRQKLTSAANAPFSAKVNNYDRVTGTSDPANPSWTGPKPANEQKRNSGHNGGHFGHNGDAQVGFPTIMPPPSVLKDGSGFKSFAQKIRHQTRDGWELIEAVYEVFTRARAAHADGLIIESATWLADRGFGKPVQVGQLLDGEGNPVAFTLWSPATNEPIGDVITLQNGKVVDEQSRPYAPPPGQLEAPKPYEPAEKDGYAHGVAAPWSGHEHEPKGGA